LKLLLKISAKHKDKKVLITEGKYEKYEKGKPFQHFSNSSIMIPIIEDDYVYGVLEVTIFYYYK